MKPTPLSAGNYEGFVIRITKDTRRLKVVFLGMNGRLTTRPLSAVAERFQLVGVVEARWNAPRPWWRTLLSGDPMAGNLKSFAEHYRVPLLQVTDGHSWGAFLEKTQAEAVCLSNFPFRLSSALYGPRPALNLHPSLLPEYRGIYPLLWQFYHQETRGGWTVHRVDEGLDTGPILAQKAFPIPFGATATQLLDQNLQTGADLLVEALEGDLAGVPQTATPERPAPLVHPGRRLVEWNDWPTRRVYHFLRGTGVWHDEFLRPPGFQLVATDFEEGPHTRPGRLKLDSAGLYVSCRDGRIRLRPAGQREELKRLALLTAAGLALLHGASTFVP